MKLTYDEARAKILSACRAHARSEHQLFAACYACVDADFPPGESDITLLSECAATLGLARSVVTRYKGWRRVQLAHVSDLDQRRLSTKVVATVGRSVEKLQDIPKAIQKVSERGVTSPYKVREVIGLKPKEAKNVTRDAVIALLKDVRRRLGRSKGNLEIDRLIVEWAEARGLTL